MAVCEVDVLHVGAGLWVALLRVGVAKFTDLAGQRTGLAAGLLQGAR